MTTIGLRDRSFISKSFLFDFLAVVGGSLLLALSAHLAIPLWFTPIPLSLQSLVVLLLGLLGPQRALMAVVTYLWQGAMGLPVFALGAGGLSRFVGPTAGYLFGFALSAYVVGWLLVERGWVKHFSLAFCALLIGSLIILIMGAGYLSTFIGLSAALMLGFVPFILDAMIKIALALMLIPQLRRAF